MVVSDLALQTAAIAHADLDLEPLCLAFDEVVRRAVPYTVAAWSTHDPATGLFTSCTMAGLPKDLEREAQLFRDEFRDDEPATFRCMIARRQTTAILSAVTGGDLERASRYRSVLAPFGVSDELRAVLWSADTPWGSVTMYRNDGARFTTAHARQMEQMARPRRRTTARWLSSSIARAVQRSAPCSSRRTASRRGSATCWAYSYWGRP
jgi:hypothetical protein